MGEPRPPPGAPVLLLVLSLAGGGGGGQENKAIFVHRRSFADQILPGDSGSKGNIGEALRELKDHLPRDWLSRRTPLTWTPRGNTFRAAPGLETRLYRRWPQKGTGRDVCPAQQKLRHLWERLPLVRHLRAYGRRRRAVILPDGRALGGTKRLAAGRAQEGQNPWTPAGPTFREETDPLKPADQPQRNLPNHPPGDASVVSGHRRATNPGARPPLPSAATEVGAAHEAGCRCPDSQRAAVPVQNMEARQGGPHVPTPRTEEAAWAASALIFLLVLLTLAVLYTRLHRKCRRGPSLYWMTGSEEGRETVAAVMKRRLFSRHRRTKRPRQPLQPPRLLLPSSSSSEDSSA